MWVDINKIWEDSSVYRPFPGKYPTKIVVRISDARFGKKLDYSGKLSPEVSSNLSNNYFRKGGVVSKMDVAEFDQNGMIRQFPMGGRLRSVPFVNCVFPIPGFLDEFLSRAEKFYVLLNRRLVTAEGKRLYRISGFETGDLATCFTRMERDCARGIFGKRWFTTEQKNLIGRQIQAQTNVWVRRVAGVPTEVEERPLNLLRMGGRRSMTGVPTRTDEMPAPTATPMNTRPVRWDPDPLTLDPVRVALDRVFAADPNPTQQNVVNMDRRFLQAVQPVGWTIGATNVHA